MARNGFFYALDRISGAFVAGKQYVDQLNWKRWSPILLRPEGLYGTRPAEGGNKAAKLKAIREALRTAKRVWLATDCDREGQLIGQEILEHYEYCGQVMRVLFTNLKRDTLAARPHRQCSRRRGASG